MLSTMHEDQLPKGGSLTRFEVFEQICAQITGWTQSYTGTGKSIEIKAKKWNWKKRKGQRHQWSKTMGNLPIFRSRQVTVWGEINKNPELLQYII